MQKVPNGFYVEQSPSGAWIMKPRAECYVNMGLGPIDANRELLAAKNLAGMIFASLDMQALGVAVSWADVLDLLTLQAKGPEAEYKAKLEAIFGPPTFFDKKSNKGAPK